MAASYTHRQGQFLTFIYDYTKLNGQPPSEADMQRHFGVSPPSIHQMILTLEKRELIQRTPGQPRSIRLLLSRKQLPDDEPNDEPMKPTTPPKSDSILGRWRITHMDMWDHDFVDAEVEGYVRLDHGGSGEFQFGYVHGWIHQEQTEREGRPAAEWSWEGNDEMDPASGRGWAVLQDDGTLRGKIFFHTGDQSGFFAVRRGGAKPATRRKFTVLWLNKTKRPGKS